MRARIAICALLGASVLTGCKSPGSESCGAGRVNPEGVGQPCRSRVDCTGTAAVSWRDAVAGDTTARTVMFDIRLPRVLLAALVTLFIVRDGKLASDLPTMIAVLALGGFGCAEVGKSLGLPTHGYLVASDSKLLDEQCGAESAI